MNFEQKCEVTFITADGLSCKEWIDMDVRRGPIKIYKRYIHPPITPDTPCEGMCIIKERLYEAMSFKMGPLPLIQYREIV